MVFLTCLKGLVYRISGHTYTMRSEPRRSVGLRSHFYESTVSLVSGQTEIAVRFSLEMYPFA